MQPAPVSPSVPCQPGDVLAGKYVVERVLGSGGMGVVVSAHHLQLRERVALKFLHPQHVAHRETVERFLREAQAAVRIKSEHVARVADVGTLESGAPYMVMEYLTGMDLVAVLAHRGPLAVPEAVEYVLQAGEAVAEAHSLGIVHRDLKPANLFLTQRADGSPLVKVLDFGISKAMDQGGGLQQQALTSTTAVMGSPLYMSPEQVRSSRHVDARADVWSLGVVLYELVTRAHPFQADTLTGLLASVVADAPIPLRARRPDLPVELEQLIMGCLEKDPARRVPSVAHLAHGLAPFAPARAQVSVERAWSLLSGGAQRQPSLPSVSHGSLPGPLGAHSDPRGQGVAQTGSPNWGNTVRPKRTAPLIPLGIGGLLVVGLGVGVAVFASRGGDGAKSAASSATPTGAAAAESPVQNSLSSGTPGATVSATSSAVVAVPSVVSNNAVAEPAASATAPGSDNTQPLATHEAAPLAPASASTGPSTPATTVTGSRPAAAPANGPRTPVKSGGRHDLLDTR